MKKTILLAALGLISLSALGKDKPKEEGFVFTTVKENPITSIKNQNRSSTCWSFSSLGFLESELLRTGKGEYDLSEMFVVHHTMVDRAVNYVRYHGDSSFSPGGSFYDIMFCMKNYGLVPQEAMPGIMYGDSLPVHNELDATAEGYVNAIAKGKLKKLTPVWKKGLCAIYDTYLGQCPENFTYKGKEYTPMTFAQSLGLNPDDYVSLTSYTHHPFYSQFAIEIQDNWRNGLSYNLPLDEFMAVMDNAVKNGYTFAWGSDVSEQGFSFKNGIAINPQVEDIKDYSTTDRARFEEMPKYQRLDEVFKFEHPYPEIKVTPEIRQEGYEKFVTTDDHLMHITGIAKDQNGTKYYITKNSWGADGNKFGGYLNMSESYVRAKTICVMVHKDSLPKELRKKLGIN